MSEPYNTVAASEVAPMPVGLFGAGLRLRPV